MLHLLGPRRLPLGRPNPRSFNPEVPHFSALKLLFRRAGTLPTAPPSLDYTQKLPTSLGMMLNNTLGCCAEAAFFHFLQVLSANAQAQMFTAPNGTVEKLYEQGAGYVPGDPSTDNGTDLQALLKFLTKTGALMPDGTRHKILGFFEIDPSNQADLNLCAAECGAIYLGFNVPAYLEQLEAPGSVWNPLPGANKTTVGGHCVISAKYQAALAAAGNVRGAISWGSDDYTITPAFWDEQVDEAYGIVDRTFVEATGRTPFNQPLTLWEQQMRAIREGG